MPPAHRRPRPARQSPSTPPPSLPASAVTAASGNQNSAIPLTIVATAFDADDFLSINISGVPAGATLSAGTLNSDGSYTLSPAQLPGLQLNAGAAGGTLHVVVTSSEGACLGLHQVPTSRSAWR